MNRMNFSALRLSVLLTAVCLPLATSTAAFGQASPLATPSPRNDGWWQERHAKYLDQVKKAREGDGVDLIVLGDSITEGWGQNAAWKKYFAPRKPLNLGIGGDGTQHVLWRIQNGELEGLKPRALMLMIGTNNSGSPASEIAAGVEAIVAELRERLPETEILLLGIFPRGEKPDATREKLSEVNDRIAKLDGDKVHYLDIGGVFLEKDGSLDKAIMPDYLHLSEKGYEMWAEAVEPSIQKLLGEKP